MYVLKRSVTYEVITIYFGIWKVNASGSLKKIVNNIRFVSTNGDSYADYYLNIRFGSRVKQSTLSIRKIIWTLVVILTLIVAYVRLNPPEMQIDLSQMLQREMPNEDKESSALNTQTNASATNVSLDAKNIENSGLSLTLFGVVASDINTQRSATIQSRLQVRTYYVGDQIAYTRATLLEVLNDRVVLLNEGKKYILAIQGTASESGSVKTLPSETGKDTFNDPQRSLAKQIGNRPKQLDHIVKTLPILDENKIRGYAVSPGLNPALFKSAGFQEGDELKRINGHDLTDPAGYASAMALLPMAQELQFLVLRGGRTITLYLDIPSEDLNLKMQ